ncbi:MAG: type I-E CRISPR-associated protein Cas6/Cse3/CasE [Thiobacillaceae bacterium]|uniref:type I-E CRISPR-associated protein Cas6/Cse3/CasE n=1 Tax=Tepidimonas sp. TaxID=2002775 RepID=UPI004054F4CB
MSGLNLLRLPVRVPQLLRFAAEQGIKQDDTLGYTLHAWLAALFGATAPKPFRYFERRCELLAYTPEPADVLLERAQAFASPQAWAALDAPGVASKPMPSTWRTGQHLRLTVLTCPIGRHAKAEKDLYLRALDRLGEAAPERADVYRQWFIRQWAGAAQLSQVEIIGMQARSRLLRRARNGAHRLKVIERPQADFTAIAKVEDGQRFADLLARGIGRHRAFGFGMVLLAPPR